LLKGRVLKEKASVHVANHDWLYDTSGVALEKRIVLDVKHRSFGRSF